MRKKGITKLISMLAVSTMIVSVLAGCGEKDAPNEALNEASQESEASKPDASDTAESNQTLEGAEKYPEFITVDVFSVQSNFQGIQTGWFGKLVKDKFNMELNIIAPNVAGGGDTLYQTRSANGDLGDLILINMDKSRLKDMVQAGLLLDMTDYIDGRENISQYMDSIETVSELAEAEGMWAIPSGISELAATEPGEIDEPTGAPSIRWDLYKEAGYPEVDTLEDLLPVMKQMQDIAGTSDSGKPVYAFSLFKDWDGGGMQNAAALGAYYGSSSIGFAMSNDGTDEIGSMIDENDLYVRALKFFFTANQMGLVDPESTTQNFDMLSTKYKDGAVLFALWPWLGTGYYNTTENTSVGKGFQTLAINDGRYTCYGSTKASSSYGLMVGSKAEDPERIMDFVDWLYSPEGIEASGTDTNGVRGPEGLTWELKDGEPVLTDFGVQVFVDKVSDLQIPEAWGNGTYMDGISALNYTPVGSKEVSKENGVSYNISLWEDYRERTKTALSSDWREHYGTTKAPVEYFEERGLLYVMPGTSWATPEDSTDISAIREQCNQIIVDYSWRMCFAESEKEFDSLLKEMQDIVTGLGYEDVLKVDKENMEARNTLFKEISGR